MNALSTLGFGPFFSQQLDDINSVPARVAAEHRGGYEVWWQGGQGPAQLSGRLVPTLEQDGWPGVGDWVTLSPRQGAADEAGTLPAQPLTIESVLTRRTLFTRGAAGRSSRTQVIAANVDLVLVVCGLDRDFNVRRTERYLARVWASGATPLVLLNKADACAQLDQRTEQMRQACPGVQVMVTAALLGQGLEPLRCQLTGGMTAAVVGSSGAGKSTLINALLGEERMATAQVRQRDGRGCHTTTHRQLHLLPGGGLLIDTPGMRELQILDSAGIDTAFADVASLAAGCRFRDCTHQAEPGCAVQQAAATGQLPPARLAHYLEMQGEARGHELRQDQRRRRQAERKQSKRYTRDAKLLRRWKQGR